MENALFKACIHLHLNAKQNGLGAITFCRMMETTQKMA